MKKLFKNILKIMPFMLLMSTPAYASEVGTLETALNGLVTILTGTAAQLIAIVAIAGIGWAWVTGHMCLKTASIIAIGIGVIFGAPEIARLLGAG